MRNGIPAVGAPLFTKPVSPTDGALTFDVLPVEEDSPSTNDVISVAAADSKVAVMDSEEAPAVEADESVSTPIDTAQPISFADARAAMNDALGKFVATMKLFGLWPDNPHRDELRRELASLEAEVASLQTRIDNLKRLIDE